MTTYGYIGLGKMGSAMTERLLATGAAVTVFDLDGAAVDAAVQHGATAVDSSAAVAESSDIVSICVPAAEHVDAVLTGDRGISDGAHDGLRLLVHSTVHPDTMRSAHDEAAQWGVPLFDVCVAGGDANARNGEISVLAGGLTDMDDEVRALLDRYAAHVYDAGPIGSGAALKIANNVMTYAQFAAAAIGMDLVASQGGDPSVMLDIWRGLGQLGDQTDQYSTLNLFEAKDLGGLMPMLSTQVGISRKDLELALELGGTRPGADAVIAAIRDAMPAVYRTHEEQP